MKTRIISLLFVSFLLHCSVFGQAFNRPESIVYDSISQLYYYSNYGNGEDGSIGAYDPINDSAWIINKDQSVGPKGLAIYNGVLYAAESGFINGFAIPSGRRIFHVNVGTFWINDLTVDAKGFLYTGESNTGKIYRINTANGAVDEWIGGGLNNLNGLYADDKNNRLLVVFFQNHSPIMSIDLDSKAMTTLVETDFNNFDGITPDKCGNWYVSSQGSKVVFIFDSEFSYPPEIAVDQLHKPADIYYNQVLDVLCIPEIDESRLEFRDCFAACESPILLNPVNLAADVSPNQIKFEWAPLAKIDYYRFELSTNQDFTEIIAIDGTPDPEYEVEGLDTNTSYYWRVSGYHRNDHTDYSEVWNFTTGTASSTKLKEEKSGFNINPNPAASSVEIKAAKSCVSEVHLLSASGSLVLQRTFDVNFPIDGYQIDVNHLPEGLYFCRVITHDAQTHVQKLIIARH